MDLNNGALDTLEHLDFDGFIAHHRKSYPTVEEYSHRKDLFEASKARALAHNKLYRAGDRTWYMALNSLADATPDEFAQLRSTKYHKPSSHPVVRQPALTGANPPTVDWRTKGAVTAVKNQGACGSCWAFSATETVESLYVIATGKSLVLAPQTYVDCVSNPDQCGGSGG
jgi:C1A family cysteine protease